MSDDPLLFRLGGVPVYAGDLALYVEDVTLVGYTSETFLEHVGIILDFSYDDDLQSHVVHLLVDGRVQRVPKGDIKLV